MNIDGAVRTLPLFEPPIDPALLVRARKADVDLSTLFAQRAAAAPLYRYCVMFAKAMELTSSVTSLANSLLVAHEKRDAETLGNLRSNHEVANLRAQLGIREEEVNEARESRRTIEASQALATRRRDHYASLILQGQSPAELAAFDATKAAGRSTQSSGLAHLAASEAFLIPDATIGASGISSPVATATFGGQFLGKVAEVIAANYALDASKHNQTASSATTNATWERRAEDWRLQRDLANAELAQIDRQLAAQDIRIALAQLQVDFVQRQLAQAEDVSDFIRDRKFTNEELYGWLVSELSATLRQGYQLAYELATSAERAFQYERADAQTFVRATAWDGMRAGLLAGERLAQDLRRMDAAYLAQNKRDLELVKSVSLGALAPDQLLRLRHVGVAEFSLSEELFDRDFPSHYLRRVSSVSVSLHCSTGPYDGVNARLTLNNSEVRATAATPTPPTTGLERRLGVTSVIAVSHGQGDGGVFELNLRDERLLPFEGAGAHFNLSGDPPAFPELGPSEAGAQQWSFVLEGANEFPLDSIDDLVLQLRYTARHGRTPLTGVTRPRLRLFRLRTEFPDAWETYMNDVDDEIVVPSLWPLLAKGRGEAYGNITGIRLYVDVEGGTELPSPVATTPTGGDVDFSAITTGWPVVAKGWSGKTPLAPPPPPTPVPFPVGSDEDGEWRFMDASARVGLKDVWVVVEYTTTSS